MIRDLRLAIRTMSSRPGFTAAAVLTLALGIGATAAIFSIVDAAMLNPLPFHQPDRLVFLWGVAGPERDVRGASLPEVLDWAAMSTTVEGISVYDDTSMTWRGTESTARVEAEMVSASYFDLLGARPAIGRAFAPEEDRTPGSHPVAIVSDGFWKERMGGVADPTGREVVLNGRSFTVIGVMPERFSGLSFDTEVWVPSMMIGAVAFEEAHEERGARWLGAIGRLRDGVSLIEAQKNMDAVGARLADAYPDYNRDRSVDLTPALEWYLGPTRQLLLIVLAGVAVLLAVSCANVAGLQFVRASSREREMAIRLAIGGSRLVLVRQLLAEGIVLSVLGSALGLVLATIGISSLVALMPDQMLPPWADPALDGKIAALAIGLATLSGILFSLIPALRGSKLELADALREGGRNTGSGILRLRNAGAHQILVVAEIALALVLLIGGGLLIRTFERLSSVEPGFRIENVLTASFSFPDGEYEAEERAAFASALVERLGAQPGIEAVAIGSDLPATNTASASMLRIEGTPPDAAVRYYRHSVGESYFRALAIPILTGRSFDARDSRDAPPVAVVSEAMVKRFWPNEDPIGKGLVMGPQPDAPVARIVGVAGDVRFRDLTTDLRAVGAEPDVYFPLLQRTPSELAIAIRTSGDPAPATALLRRELQAMDSAIPLYAIDLMESLYGNATAQERFGSFLLASFGTIALLLAAVGLYGILAFVVSLSRREIAVRLAVGAGSSRVIRLVLRQGMTLAAAGVGLGLLASLYLTRWLESRLFGVERIDPLTLIAVSAILLAVSAIASWIPAMRASRVDPLLLLKAE